MNKKKNKLACSLVEEIPKQAVVLKQISTALQHLQCKCSKPGNLKAK